MTGVASDFGNSALNVFGIFNALAKKAQLGRSKRE
jgi:hypothetical protein